MNGIGTGRTRATRSGKVRGAQVQEHERLGTRRASGRRSPAEPRFWRTAQPRTESPPGKRGAAMRSSLRCCPPQRPRGLRDEGDCCECLTVRQALGPGGRDLSATERHHATQTRTETRWRSEGPKDGREVRTAHVRVAHVHAAIPSKDRRNDCCDDSLSEYDARLNPPQRNGFRDPHSRSDLVTK